MSTWTLHERGRVQVHEDGAIWIFGDNGRFWMTQQGQTGWCALDGDPRFDLNELRPRFPTEAELVHSLIGDPQ